MTIPATAPPERLEEDDGVEACVDVAVDEDEDDDVVATPADIVETVLEAEEDATDEVEADEGTAFCMRTCGLEMFCCPRM